MADHADDGDGDDIFVYRGGRAPQHITHTRIDKSIDEIDDYAFWNCKQLLQVDTHDGIRKVGIKAFQECKSLRRMNLKSAVEIEEYAFYKCGNLVDVEFGDRLETIRRYAFGHCTSLQHLKLPSIITIVSYALHNCKSLVDIEFSERLETLGVRTFSYCRSLQRIAIPAKRDLFYEDDESVWERFGSQYVDCEQLTTVDLVGGIHKTVASLHMKSWRTEMLAEIHRINQVLPTTAIFRKTDAVEQWMESFIDKMDHYKAEHYRYVKEGITLLELALWKAKLLGEKDEYEAETKPKKAKVESGSARKEKRVTCGADIVIKNVLPCLQLE